MIYQNQVRFSQKDCTLIRLHWCKISLNDRVLVMSTDRFRKWCETWQLTSNTMSSENAENSVFLPTLILRQIILKVHEFLVVHVSTNRHFYMFTFCVWVSQCQSTLHSMHLRNFISPYNMCPVCQQSNCPLVLPSALLKSDEFH